MVNIGCGVWSYARTCLCSAAAGRWSQTRRSLGVASVLAFRVMYSKYEIIYREWCSGVVACPTAFAGKANRMQNRQRRTDTDYYYQQPTTKREKQKTKRNSMRFSIQMVGWLAVTKCGSQFDEFFCCRFFRCFYCSDSVLLLLLSNKHLKPWNRRCTVCTFSFLFFLSFDDNQFCGTLWCFAFSLLQAFFFVLLSLKLNGNHTLCSSVCTMHVTRNSCSGNWILHSNIHIYGLKIVFSDTELDPEIVTVDYALNQIRRLHILILLFQCVGNDHLR